MPTKTSKTQPQTSAIIAAIESAYYSLRQWWPELPDAALTVFRDQTKKDARGYFWAEQWQRKAGKLHEVHISSTILHEGAESVMRTTVHEAVHAYARARGISDTSRQGRYHNRKFAKLAAEFGLMVAEIEVIGHITPGLTPDGKKKYTAQIKALTAVLGDFWQEPIRANERSSTPSRMLKYECDCFDPRIIRIAAATAELGAITCVVCGCQFHTTA